MDVEDAAAVRPLHSRAGSVRLARTMRTTAANR